MPGGKVEVTAIIVNYRYAAGAVTAAESVLAQDAAVEVWVVDNSEEAAEAGRLREALGGRCRLLINTRNVGFGAACNQVFGQTSSDYVFLLNPDARCLPGALPVLVDFLRRERRAAGAAPRTYLDEAHRFILPALYLPPWWWPALSRPLHKPLGLAVWLYSLRCRAEALHLWQAEQPVRQPGLTGGHLLARRQAVERAGGLFDPQFYLYGEDADLSLRLRRCGWGLYLVPRAKVVHAFGSTGTDRAGWKQAQALLAEKQLLRKRYGRNRRLQMLAFVQRRMAGRPWQPRIETAPVSAGLPAWTVPEAWRAGWLLEIGMSPFLLPAGGVLGAGETAQIPASALHALQPGTYFARLGPARASWLRPRVWDWPVACPHGATPEGD